MGPRRGEVLRELRRVARGRGSATLRASAILALGRMGEDQEASFFIHLLRDRKQPNDVLEAAALALGMLPPLEEGAVRRATREHLEYFLKHDDTLPRRARELAIVAAGLRARHDKMLAMRLAARAIGRVKNSQEAAAVAFACGLSGERMIFPELQRAARRAELGGTALNDVARSHATLALARLGDPTAAQPALSKLRRRAAVPFDEGSAEGSR